MDEHSPGVHNHAEIRRDVSEGKMINLSIETKVAIAVATGLVMLIVGAMAQG